MLSGGFLVVTGVQFRRVAAGMSTSLRFPLFHPSASVKWGLRGVGSDVDGLSVQECQSLVDRTSLVVIGVPLAVAAAWIAYLVRPIPKKLMEQEEMFEDPSTGIIFQAAEGQKPERDAKALSSLDVTCDA